MNQHDVLLICLLTGYVAVNVITALRSRVFLLAQSRARLALYGIAFLLWGFSNRIGNRAHGARASIG